MNMRTINFFAVILFSLITVNTTAQQKQTNFGHVNRSEIMQMMPEVKQARSDLEKYSKQMQGQVKNLMKEYRSKLEKFQEQQNSMSETVRKDKERELTQLEERIQKFRKEAQKEVSKKRKELLQPIIDRIDKAIKQVAQQNGYSYIFDTSAGAVLYAQDSDDVTTLVKQKLGLN